VLPAEHTRWICDRARAAGFDLCGVAPVSPGDSFPELARLPEWLARGYAGEMHYLHDPRRADPGSLLAGSRSLIVVAVNYHTPPHAPSTSQPAHPAAAPLPRARISRYAWGDDYHEVLAEKLQSLLAEMRRRFPEPFEARAYVDTGPVIERVAAKYAGLGWLGKNTCLINSQLGSWLFLGVIVTTLPLAPSLALGDPPPPDLCGTCTRCLDACPTQAFPAPYVLDARRCISYLTIELRGAIPEELRAPMGPHVLGCDICQDVCPWNRKAPFTAIPAFQPRELAAEQQSLAAPALEWLASLSQQDFSHAFRASAAKRAKWRGLVRNACIALGNSSLRPKDPAHARAAELLDRLACSADPLIAEHARWALARLSASPQASAAFENVPDSSKTSPKTQ